MPTSGGSANRCLPLGGGDNGLGNLPAGKVCMKVDDAAFNRDAVVLDY